MTQKLLNILFIKKWYLPEYKVSLVHAMLQRPQQ